MDETKVLNILSIMQFNIKQTEYDKDTYNMMQQVLQLAMDDIALVMNILAIYNDEMHEDYLYIVDDIIKAFMEQRREK